MTFLFDIGRVLLDFDFESSLARLLPADVADPAERLELLIERKDEFETGNIDAETYIQWALETLGSGASPDEFREAWRHIFTPNEPMWRVAGRLADEGHRLILFSNINTIHAPWIFDAFPNFSIFHGAVLSFETGFIKPYREIYNHAIRKYGLIPGETIYMDDLPANIATGREMGFRCWQYDLKNHAAFEEWLEGELVSQPETGSV
jgi:FMN phosphatase YigB (HAD superfamily)